MSAASVRLKFMLGIFEWGSRRNVASPVSLKFGRLAISSKGGASALAWRWSEVTTWHAAHHRCASRSPFKASAAWTGIAAETNPKAATQNAALVILVLALK